MRLLKASLYKTGLKKKKNSKVQKALKKLRQDRKAKSTEAKTAYMKKESHTYTELEQNTQFKAETAKARRITGKNRQKRENQSQELLKQIKSGKRPKEKVPVTGKLKPQIRW